MTLSSSEEPNEDSGPAKMSSLIERELCGWTWRNFRWDDEKEQDTRDERASPVLY